MEQESVLTEAKRKKAQIISDIICGNPVTGSDILSICTSVYLSGLRDGRKLERSFPAETDNQRPPVGP